jgi:integrase
MHFHDLRHSYASMLLAEGVEVDKLSLWMGQANISSTDAIYADLYPGDHTADAERLASYLGRSACGR